MAFGITQGTVHTMHLAFPESWLSLILSQAKSSPELSSRSTNRLFLEWQRRLEAEDEALI